MKLFLLNSLGAILFICCSIQAHGEPLNQLRGLIVSTQGKVQVLTPDFDKGRPSNKPVLLFEGKKFFYEDAKTGLEVHSGQVILCSDNGKAKIIYSHGDLMVVSAFSSFTIPEVSKDKTSSSPRSEMSVLYGNLRGVVSPKGPLQKLRIKTPVAVMGIRGTDLFLSYDPAQVKTELQVLRGEVQIQPTITIDLLAKTDFEKLQDSAKPISTEKPILSVKAAEKASVEISDEFASGSVGSNENSLSTSIDKATQTDLDKVTQLSTIKPDVIPESQPDSSAIKAKIEIAEKSALENTLEDIKKYAESDKSSLQDLSKITTLEQANAYSVEKIKATASKATEKNPNDEDSKSDQGQQPHRFGAQPPFWRKACREDIQQFCKLEMGQPKRVKKCLILYFESLGVSCKKQVDNLLEKRKEALEKLKKQGTGK